MDTFEPVLLDPPVDRFFVPPFLPPAPSPISPKAITTDDLSVEPMSMEDDSKGETEEQVKIIPRLVDSAGQAAMPRSKDNNLNPSSWTVQEVAQFLQINECATLADAFQEQVSN